MSELVQCTYTSPNKNLKLSLGSGPKEELVDGKVITVLASRGSVDFNGGVFVTSKPDLIEFLDSHPWLNYRFFKTRAEKIVVRQSQKKVEAQKSAAVSEKAERIVKEMASVDLSEEAPDSPDFVAPHITTAQETDGHVEPEVEELVTTEELVDVKPVTTVRTFNEARDYLSKTFGFPKKNLGNIETVTRVAADHGVSFPNWKPVTGG